MMMKDKWQQLSSRERRLVVIMSAVLVVTMFYFLLWQPMQDGLARSRVRVKAQQAQLQEMRQQAAIARQLLAKQRSGSAVKNSSSLLVVIERTAQQKQIKSALQKVQPEGNEGVRIWLENASFDKLVDWLALLSSRNNVYVSEISIDRQKDSGLVNGRILLQVAS